MTSLDDLDPVEITAATDAVARAVCWRGVHVLCGSLRPDGGRWRNAAIYFAPDGARWIYDKVNLAGHERGRPAPGSTLPVQSIPVGSGRVRTGVQLCREIRSSEQWHVLARPASLRVELDLGEVRDGYVSQQRADVVALVQMTS